MSMVQTYIYNKVAGGKGITEMKLKQQSPCNNCMHWPVMSWLLWHHRLITWLLQALTAWNLKFQVCLDIPKLQLLCIYKQLFYFWTVRKNLNDFRYLWSKPASKNSSSILSCAVSINLDEFRYLWSKPTSTNSSSTLNCQQKLKWFYISMVQTCIYKQLFLPELCSQHKPRWI